MIQNTLMRACIAIFAAIEKYYVPELQVDISKKGTGTHLNGMFVAERLQGMLEGKDHNIKDMAISFFGQFINPCSGRMNEAPPTKVHGLYSVLMLSMKTDNCCRV